MSLRDTRNVLQAPYTQGLVTEEFAAISGLHRTYIGAVERGEKNLTISTLHTLAKTLDTSIAQLFRGIA